MNPDLETNPTKPSETVWDTTMADMPEFGKAKLTDAQIKDIYEGNNLYGADHVNFCKDEKSLNHLISSMNTWGNVSVFHGHLVGKDKDGKTVESVLENRENILHEMVNYVSNAYDIKDTPELVLDSDNIGIADGGYEVKTNKIALQKSLIGTLTSADDALKFVAHEMMHCYDETVTSKDGSILGAMLKYNSEHYANNIHDDGGYDAYKNQLRERRAYAREKVVMDQFTEFKNKPLNRFKRLFPQQKRP